jgi:hypothetical protein
MNHPSLSAQQIYDTAPLGSLIRFSDGTPEPPARHRRKHAAWESSNGTGRLTRKAPANSASAASFTLHLADFGSGDVTVVKAYRTVPVTSSLIYAIVETPRPGQAAILRDEGGMATLLHLADSHAGAESWLKAHSCRDARIVAAGAPEPRTFTYLQDPGHGWLIVDRADLASAGMTPADFTVCSHVHGDTFALEEDVDMPKFVKRLADRGIAYRLRQQHTNNDAYVRNSSSNGRAAPSTEGAA